MGAEIDLQGFYPEYVKIEEVQQSGPTELDIYGMTITQTAKCPECGKDSAHVHSHSMRKNVRDLPILGRGVRLTILAQKYYCRNTECGTNIFVEPLPGLIGSREKWTERCEAFIVAVAMNTSCESAARICALMNIPVSGDTVIRMLLRNVRNTAYTGESIGIDDWATRKGHHYGTMICDMESHKPIALLPGRDGDSVREWLKHNKQVKLVSRDRAGAYAKAISDILPEAVQIADRFHLHHNLLEAVQEALKSIVPEKVWITDQEGNLEDTEKKIPEPKVPDVDRRINETNRKALILQAQALYTKGLSRTDISVLLAIPIKRLRRYLSGNADQMCRDGRSYIERASSLDPHHGEIEQMLGNGNSLKDIHHNLDIIGVKISYSTLCRYCDKHFESGRMRTVLKNPPVRHAVSRRQIREHIWSDKELDPKDLQWLFDHYPDLPTLLEYITSFREALSAESSLIAWIAYAKTATIPSICSFANGLDRDLVAVLNAARFKESNAFLEGNVNRLKMIKRSMFGRAGSSLLSAKVVGLIAYS